MVYTIQNHGVRYWTGVTPNNKQVIMGPSIPNIVMYVFSPQGELEDKKVFSMNPVPVWDNEGHVYLTDAAFIAGMEQQVNAIQQQMGITGKSIQVQRFFDKDEDIGIRDLPEEFEQYLEHGGRGGYTEEDRESLAESIKDWRASGRFVFVWGDEIGLSQNGEVWSS